ncbi:MAG: tRNA pseudouridine(55) synthase TruB [Clostridiales bacterium]|nr:tRNA pseudouridine(55) synthase TruB [Clostridiales bacterium]
MKGLLNLYKPRGCTSSDMVVACKKILETRAVGHMGTLDPEGEGVLLLGVGKATRLFDYYLQKDKEYEAEFAFGYQTDTLDATGTIVATSSVLPQEDQIIDACPKLIGKQMQMPPAYSAKSVNGVRAYKLARQGIEVQLSPKEVEIYALSLVRQTAPNTFLMHVHCSAGTYIRSLCRDIAALLGTVATMVSIKRLRCGNFLLSDSVTLDELTVLKEKALLSVEDALASVPRVDIAPERYTELCNGIKQPTVNDSGDIFTVYCKNELFGLGCNKDGKIHIQTYLRETN